jgi:hypothetical protein
MSCQFSLLLAIWSHVSSESNNLMYHVVARMENQYVEFSGQPRATNLLSDDQWAYDLVANIDQCLPNTQLGNCSRLPGHAGGVEQTSP